MGMKQITNQEYEEFQKYKSDKLHGHILTPEGLRFIIEANENDAQKIGQHFLEMLPQILPRQDEEISRELRKHLEKQTI